MKRTSSMIYTPSYEADDLFLYADNTSSLYFHNIIPVINNLHKKYVKGVYDSEKATELWYYVAEEAARLYRKEFCESGSKLFNVTERWTVAVMMEEHFLDDVKEGINL